MYIIRSRYAVLCCISERKSMSTGQNSEVFSVNHDCIRDIAHRQCMSCRCHIFQSTACTKREMFCLIILLSVLDNNYADEKYTDFPLENSN